MVHTWGVPILMQWKSIMLVLPRVHDAMEEHEGGTHLGGTDAPKPDRKRLAEVEHRRDACKLEIVSALVHGSACAR